MRPSLKIFLLVLAFLPWRASAAVPPAGSLVKASGPAVYYFANDGKRYVFPNQRTYASWFTDFSGIAAVSDAELASMPLGGNVTYRPGIRMLKIQTDPKIYAVVTGGTLRWVTTAALAESLYGPYWNTHIDDVSDAFFVNYQQGEPIDSADDFSPALSAQAVDTIEADKGIPLPPAPRRADTQVSNVIEGWRTFALNHINLLRQQNGKSPVVMNALLNEIAMIHSRDMAINLKNLQHEGFLGETPDERMRQGKVPDVENRVFVIVPHPQDFGWSGENVGMASGYRETVEKSIERLHNAFMDEPPDVPNHRTTMLSTLHPYDQVGIGPYVDVDGGFWLTEDFISPQE